MTEEKWVVTAKRADFQKIGEKFSIDPVIARLIRNRDVVGDEEIQNYLYGSLDQLFDPFLMKDMEKAVAIIQKKIKEKAKIRIIGDYDIDGVTSTYILLKGLGELGADIDTYIPDRITDGYGIHEGLIQNAIQDGVDTILTCDNGIAAAQEIQSAKDAGLTVIVTDHHEIPYEEKEGSIREILPPADAIINPKQKKCQYPCKLLCGAAVAFKLICALYEREGISKEKRKEYLDLVAVATVGDVMDLKEENRIFVKEGLKYLRNTSNIGLQELIRANGLEDRKISAYHIGFVLGPCINASGRLDTASRSLKLLLEKDRQKAAQMAGDLMAMNQSRKALTQEGVEEAVKQIEEGGLSEDRVLVVYLPDCHESLAGIIAGRLRERYHKPAFALTKGEQGVKGSGRSIEAYSMYDALNECRELLTKFGGHPMAAGLSLEEKNVEAFREKINRLCRLTREDLFPKVVIDVPMPISYITRELVEELELLEPFGKGNTKPVFAQKGIMVLNPRIFGQNRNVVKMQVVDETGFSMEAVYFGDGDEFVEAVRGRKKVSIVYYPGINSYNGRENLQITIQSCQ